jgi:ABC-type nitrate/sulfonate/bicarbonate transport system substrate-binding protein
MAGFHESLLADGSAPRLSAGLAKKINIAVNMYNFQWTFPEMVADELGLFTEQGLEAKWLDITPSGLADKAALYTELLQSRKTDVYHAGEWVCILRVLGSKGARIISKSTPSPGTLNSTFSLWVRGGSEYKSPAELKDKPIAIEMGTGSYYTVLQDLERYMPKASAKLVAMGEPHKRFLALLDEKVEAASLLSPWADVAKAASFVEILKTERSNPTTIVAREDDDLDKLRRFFLATNEAIDRMNKKPDDFRELYFKKVERAMSEMPAKVKKIGQGVKKTLAVPKWNHWVAYEKRDFDKTYAWMVKRGLAPSGHTSREVVTANSKQIFG